MTRAELYPVPAPVPRARLTSIAPGQITLQAVIGQATRDKLEYAQALLAHQVRPGDVAKVLDRALDALIAKLEQGKFAATSRPQARRRATMSRRRSGP